MENLNKRSIIDMARGAIKERADYEMTRVVENILDPNTSATAARKITITLTLKSDDTRQNIAVSCVAKSNYQRITEGAYGYGQQRLQETLGLDDEAIYELDGYMDFEKYGQDCMENDCVTKTEFGLLRRIEPPFPEQRQGQRMM